MPHITGKVWTAEDNIVYERNKESRNRQGLSPHRYRQSQIPESHLGILETLVYTWQNLTFEEGNLMSNILDESGDIIIDTEFVKLSKEEKLKELNKSCVKYTKDKADLKKIIINFLKVRKLDFNMVRYVHDELKKEKVNFSGISLEGPYPYQEYHNGN